MIKEINKVLLIVIVAILAISSCKKEAEPELPNSGACNCGIVESRNTDQSGNPYFMVKNNCSGTSKKFYVEWGVWNNTAAGDEVCFSNVDEWK